MRSLNGSESTEWIELPTIADTQSKIEFRIADDKIAKFYCNLAWMYIVYSVKL